MDNFYSDEEEMKREYERYKDNFLYNQNVRTAMLNTFDEEGRDLLALVQTLSILPCLYPLLDKSLN